MKKDIRTYKNFKYWPSKKLAEVLEHPYNQGIDGADYGPYIEEIQEAYWDQLNTENEKISKEMDNIANQIMPLNQQK